jgi:hypothetical protein
MMRKFVRALLLLLAGTLAVFAAKVITDYNHSMDLSHYKTYSWLKVEPDPLWIDRISNAVDAQLLEKAVAEMFKHFPPKPKE